MALPMSCCTDASSPCEAEIARPHTELVSGSSMWPFIRSGDVVTAEPLGETPPRLGDVLAVTLPRSGKLALHRAVSRADGGWVMRGDALEVADGVVSAEDVLGRVVDCERGGRAVRLGVTRGRAAIALLSRTGALRVLTRAARRLRQAGTRTEERGA